MPKVNGSRVGFFRVQHLKLQGWFRVGTKPSGLLRKVAKLLTPLSPRSRKGNLTSTIKYVLVLTE